MSLFFKRINFELIFSIKLMSSDIPLTEKESKIRKTLLTDKNGEYSVIYDLLLVVRKPLDNKTGEKHNFEGHLELTLTYHPKNNVKSGLFLNFKGEIHSLRINSQKIDKINYENHRLTIDLSLLKYKENKIRILYSGDYNHNGVGLNHYIDPLDNKEYLYTQFQPCECQRLFPCFDQPDIKAILKLKVLAPKEWRVLSNAYESSIFDFKSNEQLKIFNFSEDSIKILVDIHKIISKEYKLHIFEEIGEFNGGVDYDYTTIRNMVEDRLDETFVWADYDYGRKYNATHNAIPNDCQIENWEYLSKNKIADGYVFVQNDYRDKRKINTVQMCNLWCNRVEWKDAEFRIGSHKRNKQ